jgi:hypothetical protein
MQMYYSTGRLDASGNRVAGGETPYFKSNASGSSAPRMPQQDIISMFRNQQPSAAVGAPSVGAPSSGSPNIFQTSSNLFNQAAQGPNINQFMNPYTSMVTDNAMADLERQRQMQINATGAAASRAGAFGGSRHGVAEAQTNLGFGQQGAQLFGNLQQQGFNTALGAAQDQQRMQSGLAGQGFGFGQAIGQQQAQQGAQQQAINQAIIDAARNQYQGFTGAPQNSLATILGAMGAMPNQSTQTQTQRPGAFNWLGLLAAL